MFLKLLEIQGFKSFPDKTTLTFGKGITAVVGPNGSGKSNISDAIRWVLGEMSAKSLRGSRMEDVIFGGTVLRRAQGFAEVTLTINNSGREFAYDGDEFSVTRRFFRSGESEYLLNRTVVRLRDIYLLFMDTGLGRDGYSIIGQGRIAEIVAARSEDRREIFEEAAGISKYRYRKEESEHRLAAAEDNLARLRDILMELEGRIGPLREQAERARRYIDLAVEKKTLEVGLWLFALDRQRDVLREQDNRLSLARSQHEEIELKMETLASNIEAAYMETQKTAAEADEHREKARSYEEAAAKNEAQVAVIENDIAHNGVRISRINGEINEIENIGQTYEDDAAVRRGVLERLEARQKKLENELAQCENSVLNLTGMGDEIANRIETANALMSFINIEISQLKLSKNTEESHIRHIDERLAAIDCDKAVKSEKLNGANALFEEATKRIQSLGQRAEELSNELKGYEIKRDTRRDKLRASEEKTRSLSLKISEKTQRAGMLADLERQMEGFSHSVKSVMRERERGLLGGIHGPVSRMINVSAQYAVAIETALSAAAQNIIVSDEDDAKAAIAFLKNSDGGRATFLPLTSVKGSVLSQNGASQCAGYIGIASELVEYAAQYDGVMKNLLGRTVVAEDLNTAVAIAKRFQYGFRIVTLDGQLVNAGGSLTGGSLNKTAGLLSRKAEIEALKAEAEKLQGEMSTAEAGKNTVMTEVSSLESAISGISGQLLTVQEDIIRAKGRQQFAKEQVEGLEVDMKALETECETCVGRHHNLEESITVTNERISLQEKDAASAQAELEKLGVDKNVLVEKREAQAEELTILKLDNLACVKDIEAARFSLAEIEHRQTDHAGRVAGLKAEAARLQEENQSAGSSAAQLIEQAEKQRAMAAESFCEAEKTVYRRNEIERSGVELRAAERSLSDDRDKISRELARLEERRDTAQTEYDGLISRLWEEYEFTRSQAEMISERILEPTVAQKRLNSVKKEIKDLGGVNVAAIEEFKEVSQRYTFLKEQTDDVEKSKLELLSLIIDLTGKMREIFIVQFDDINRNFSQTFVELFGGGNARLKLTEPEDVLASGIEIIVQPPGKIINNLAALSGGEQAFVAIALYFAILKVRPSPFCVLDEIEAALDDANVTRFASYLRRMCRNTQFIVITHRRGTMDEADVLYGVTMQDEGVSKLLTLNVSELMSRLGIAV